MDDRVSRWLYDNWYKPNFNHKNMLLACVMARLLNNTDSLEHVRFPSSWKRKSVLDILEGRTQSKLKNFSGAYLVSGSKGISKVEHVVNNVLQPIYASPPLINRDNMQETVQRLMKYNGLGSFLAGQVTADLRWAVEGRWLDKDTFAPIGPGSRRGMNRLHGRLPDQVIKDSVFTQELMALKRLCIKCLKPSITKRLEAIDYQNTLCEFWKMERTVFPGLSTTSRPKQLYPGVN